MPFNLNRRGLDGVAGPKIAAATFLQTLVIGVMAILFPSETKVSCFSEPSPLAWAQIVGGFLSSIKLFNPASDFFLGPHLREGFARSDLFA